MTSDRTRLLSRVAERIGHEFRDLDLLDRALTHASLGNEGLPSYERLEFLGDAVLGFVVADHLYGREPEVPEGQLTDRRALIVSREPLAAISRELELSSALAVGRGLRDEDIDSPRIQADLVEAVLGAVYLDGGIRAARRFVRRHVLSTIDPRLDVRKVRDAKSRLLHLAQTLGLGQPRYSIVDYEGPDHDRVFTVSAWIGEREIGRGSGRQKQVAEMEAAEQGIERLQRQAGERKGAEGAD